VASGENSEHKSENLERVSDGWFQIENLNEFLNF
jgi:hypothetical protein